MSSERSARSTVRWLETRQGSVHAESLVLYLESKTQPQSAIAVRDQIVFHLKNVRHAIGAQAREIFVRFAIDDAFQTDMPIFHDDVNRGHRRPPVFRKHGIAIDIAITRMAQLVSHRRRWS